MDRDSLDTPQFHLFCIWFIVCLCVFMCLCVWERESPLCDVISWFSLLKKKTKTQNSGHMFFQTMNKQNWESTLQSSPPSLTSICLRPSLHLPSGLCLLPLLSSIRCHPRLGSFYPAIQCEDRFRVKWMMGNWGLLSYTDQKKIRPNWQLSYFMIIQNVNGQSQIRISQSSLASRALSHPEWRMWRRWERWPETGVLSLSDQCPLWCHKELVSIPCMSCSHTSRACIKK